MPTCQVAKIRRDKHQQCTVWITAAAFFMLGNLPAEASDWPQFMRGSQHTGDAAEEQLRMPLRLLAQVRLDEAVMTSPAVVGGRVYVVDQMGTAYCVESKGGRIVWKSAPERDQAVGGNTSSPCIAAGKVFYGTTAGNLHILDAASGKVVRSILYRQPILGSICLANDSVYFQTLDGVVHCLDLDGNRRWRWSHYGVDDDSAAKSKPQYSGVAVSVSGSRVVMATGFDLVCIDDLKTKAEHVWTRREIMGKTYLPVATSIRGGHVYCALPGKDGLGIFLRVSLQDGTFDEKQDVLRDQWAVMAAPAVRGATAYFSRQAFGVTAHRFGPGASDLWRSFGDDPHNFTPSLSSPALSQKYCVFTTLGGELVAVDIAARGRGLDELSNSLFRFKTPHGRVISSSPAIADGRVYFGCDDGYLYVLGNGDAIQPSKEQPTIHQRRGKVVPAGEKRYAWPSAFGGSRNANFVDDGAFRPPFRVRWAARSGGLFKQPVCATEEDVVYCTLGGLVVAREQQSGRIRWRRKLAKQVWTRATLLCADGKVYVPRMFSLRYPKVKGRVGVMSCLDGRTGEILWEKPIGIGDRLRASPVFADGVVAFGSLYSPPRTGRPVIPQGAVWRYWVGSDPPGNWTTTDFDSRAWKKGKAGFGYGDDDDQTELDMKAKYTRVYIRRSFDGKDLAGAGELGLMVNYDDAFIAYLNGHEVARAGITSGSGKIARGIQMHEAEGFEYFSLKNWREHVRPGNNVIALEGHNVGISSSDFSLHPYLLIGRHDEPVGQAVDAWDADTGRHLWQVKFNSKGRRLNGPAGCAGDGLMFFAGGGESPSATGETIAIVPRTGKVVWRTARAFASQTGTPAFQNGKLYLPGAYKLPLTCLSARDGRILWQQQDSRNRWYVDTVSLAPNYFTVNNKYSGGAKRRNISDGTLAGPPGKPIQLWGPAHGCGSVVLTSQGMALSATIGGLCMVDTNSGKLLWKSPGFASYTCPHPIASNGRMFYCPQTSGIMFCFEPANAN